MASLFSVFCILCIFISCESSAQEKRDEEIDARKKEIADSVKQAKEEAERNEPRNRVGRYVYIDQVGVLHTYLHCHAINEGGTLSGYTTDDEGEDIEVSNSIKCGSGVRRVLLKEMDKSLLKKSCNVCIDDAMYDYLLKYGTLEGLFGEESDRHKRLTGVKW